MTWTVDTGVALSALISTINTNLTASGWTDADPGYSVFTSTNDQGATNCVQITNCQTSGAAADASNNRYLQFQGWLSWNAGTHAGTSGSGTTYRRVYYAAANVADTTEVDLYMSVTANRFIIFIQGVNNFRYWIYCGGLDALAGTADTYCVVLASAFEQSAIGSIYLGAILGGETGSLWTTIDCATIAVTTPSNGADAAALTATPLNTAELTNDSAQVLIFPVLVVSGSFIRGGLDGICYMPTQKSGHLDTLTVSGTTYLLIRPGGATGISNTGRPITANYLHGLAIAEV